MDRTLTVSERLAIVVLWQCLSPLEYRPMKPEALAFMLTIKRQSASRILRRLVELGYLLMIHPDPRAPRQYLLVNS
ncbi:MAG: hypothetical protein MUE41_04130 [Gemmatimonadaceae bacterium]|jgi:DNA-binding MarR family transcriptional regulator|nr:hypothetical protein [Gemmatimonadaceae bacterium]